jgi:hypothetical protein
MNRSEPYSPSQDTWRRGQSEPGQPPLYKGGADVVGGTSAPSGRPLGEHKSKNPVIAELQVEIESTQEILRNNIDLVAERGERLDALQDRTGEWLSLDLMTANASIKTSCSTSLSCSVAQRRRHGDRCGGATRRSVSASP